jgi:hypothetical protein
VAIKPHLAASSPTSSPSIIPTSADTPTPPPSTPITPLDIAQAKTEQPLTPPETTPASQFQKSLPGITTPPTPSLPNLVSGTVIDPQNKLLENAIIEIKNRNGQAVRALKTNRLGQFAIATPLKAGNYQIQVEKDPHTFDIIALEAADEVITPLTIPATDR